MTPQRLQIYLRDEASPSIDLAVLIERVTEGKVCVLDWIKAKDGR
jgi:hypothetical protein